MCVCSRLAVLSDVSSEALIASLVHIVRIHALFPTLPIDNFTIHRLLLTRSVVVVVALLRPPPLLFCVCVSSLLVSAKCLDDLFLNNLDYARISGVSLQELNLMEVEFLSLLDFKVQVDTDHYVRIYNELIKVKNPDTATAAAAAPAIVP